MTMITRIHDLWKLLEENYSSSFITSFFHRYVIPFPFILNTHSLWSQICVFICFYPLRPPWFMGRVSWLATGNRHGCVNQPYLRTWISKGYIHGTWTRYRGLISPRHPVASEIGRQGELVVWFWGKLPIWTKQGWSSVVNQGCYNESQWKFKQPKSQEIQQQPGISTITIYQIKSARTEGAGAWSSGWHS